MPGTGIAENDRFLPFYAEFAEKDTEAYRTVCKGCGEITPSFAIVHLNPREWECMSYVSGVHGECMSYV